MVYRGDDDQVKQVRCVIFMDKYLEPAKGDSTLNDSFPDDSDGKPKKPLECGAEPPLVRN